MTYQTGPVLADCLAALLPQSGVGEIIVVDNGNSPTASAWLDRLAQEQSTVQLLRPDHNLGFSAGCNLGASIAKGTFLAFVNPDLIVPPGSFERILSVFAEHENAWLCGGRLLNMDGSEQRGGRREVLTPWRALVEVMRLDRLAPSHPHFSRFHLLDQAPPLEAVNAPTISGAFMVMPRHRFASLGGMDEDMFLHMEDVDLCLRVLLQGGEVLYCGNVPVYHQRSTSAVARSFIEWHKTRSTIRYFFKHFHTSYPAWSLHLMTGLLLLRFLGVALLELPHDLPFWKRKRSSMIDGE